MHVAIVMNSASGMTTLRSDLIRFLQSLQHQVSAVCPVDVNASELKRMGVIVEEWIVSRDGMNPVQEGRAIIRLRRILARIQPDVILCFTPKAVLLGSLAARAAPRSPVFSVLTGLGFLFGDRPRLIHALSPLVTTLFRYALRYNRIVFFQNPDDLELFVSQRIVPLGRTCRVYGSGVDTKRFAPEVLPKTCGETVFLMIGRLIAAKGILDFIEAARILKREQWPGAIPDSGRIRRSSDRYRPKYNSIIRQLRNNRVLRDYSRRTSLSSRCRRIRSAIVLP